MTDPGTLDPTKFPIEPVLRQTLSRNFDEFRSGCMFLDTMAYHGRMEAGVYLLGLLQHYQDDLSRLEVVVEALGHIQNQACAAALFDELRRLKASNATRRYLVPWDSRGEAAKECDDPGAGPRTPGLAHGWIRPLIPPATSRYGYRRSVRCSASGASRIATIEAIRAGSGVTTRANPVARVVE